MKKIIAILLAICAAAALTVSAFAAASPEPETAAVPAETAEVAAKLSDADALAAALKDAGVKEADVTVTKNRLSEKSTEDGETLPVYTVKFSTDTTEYKYYIDGNTGAVIYKSVEFQNPDIVLKSRGSAAGEASAEMGGRSARASGEAETGTDAAADTAESVRGAGRHKSANAVTGASEDLTDA